MLTSIDLIFMVLLYGTIAAGAAWAWKRGASKGGVPAGILAATLAIVVLYGVWIGAAAGIGAWLDARREQAAQERQAAREQAAYLANPYDCAQRDRFVRQSEWQLVGKGSAFSVRLRPEDFRLGISHDEAWELATEDFGWICFNQTDWTEFRETAPLGAELSA